jgi:FKBP-type peptidyl-prolyl cis-trans isomerase FkpA
MPTLSRAFSRTSLPGQFVRSFALCLALTSAANAADAPEFPAHEQELLYFWGTQFGDQLDLAGIRSATDVDWVVRGLRDRAAGKSPGFTQEHPSMLNNFLVARSKAAAQEEAARSLAYVKEMAREPGAMQTGSGLVYRELVAGSGAQPNKESKVKVHYTGTLRDGRVFDSSRERGLPLEATLTGVISCWQEAIPMMKTGGRAKITCPSELAYGERTSARIPGGSALVFDVELLEVIKE